MSVVKELDYFIILFAFKEKCIFFFHNQCRSGFFGVRSGSALFAYVSIMGHCS